MGAIHCISALYLVACLDSLRDPFKSSYLELPFGTPRNALSPECDHPGASPLVRYRGSTAVSLSRTPQRVPPRRTSSNICCDLAHGSLQSYGRSSGSGITDLTPFSCGPYRRPTRSVGISPTPTLRLRHGRQSQDSLCLPQHT